MQCKVKKTQTRPAKAIKKVARDHYGTCTLRELPANTYFRTVNSKGTVSKKTYLKQKNSYDRSVGKYVVTECDDAWGSGKELKPSQKVTTAFEY